MRGLIQCARDDSINVDRLDKAGQQSSLYTREDIIINIILSKALVIPPILKIKNLVLLVHLAGYNCQYYFIQSLGNSSNFENKKSSPPYTLNRI